MSVKAQTAVKMAAKPDAEFPVLGADMPALSTAAPRLQGAWRNRVALPKSPETEAKAAVADEGEQHPVSLPAAAEPDAEKPSATLEKDDGGESVSEQSTAADDAADSISISPTTSADDLTAEDCTEEATEPASSMQSNEQEAPQEMVSKGDKTAEVTPKAPAAGPRIVYLDAPEVETFEILADVKPFSPQVRNNPALASLLTQVRHLSEECFHEDCLEGCSNRGGWRLTMLVAFMDRGTEACLLGFIVYRLKPELKAFSVAKLAVPSVFRRRGYGKQLITWGVQCAKKNPDIDVMALSSLPTAVAFYQRIGFKRLHEITAKEGEDNDDLFPGQIYMEYRTKGGKVKSAGCKRR